MSSELHRHLQVYCERAFPGRLDITVSMPVSLSAGWESETYAFDVEFGLIEARQREALLLRLYSGRDAAIESVHEFQSLQQLRRLGYPVPHVALAGGERSPFGKPFIIMERINGRVMWSLLEEAPLKRQQELLTFFCELLARLHRLDWRLFAADESRGEMPGPYAFVDQWLRDAWDALERFPMPGFFAVVAWLRQRRDGLPCLRPAITHGDFHPGNILLRREDQSAVVIDWSRLRISDARFDLAWTLLLTNIHETSVRRDDDGRGQRWRYYILQEYERLTGAAVNEVECFEVCACAMRLFIVTAALLFPEGAGKLGLGPDAVKQMRHKMTTIRQVYEMLRERTSLRVTEVERLLETFS
jgi:aminoglycoside phosphotransferase (APT) family kinase protein